MEILFVFDFVCPFCFVAKQALEQAVSQLKIAPSIQYLPYQLTMEPKPRVDTYSDPARRAHYQKLAEPCRQMGLAAKIPPHIIPRPYSRLALEGWYHACNMGKGSAYFDRIFNAYFLQEQDIGELSVLKDLAQEVGLDPDRFCQDLAEGRFREPLNQQDEYSRTVLHVSSVPTIYLNGRPAPVSAYTPQEFCDLLRQADCAQKACGCSGCSLV
ncbi:MAG: DsbA family protein [Pygmaiobacter massiliensis]|nr:DsbA family protein [Pygmaiobacter massiliensis]